MRLKVRKVGLRAGLAKPEEQMLCYNKVLESYKKVAASFFPNYSLGVFKSRKQILRWCAVAGSIGITSLVLWHGYTPQHDLSQVVPLRVLCAENWLSEDRLKRFSERVRVPIQFFTYARPSEFLRQMANADGKVDVVCTSSWLLRSLVRSHWLKAMNYQDLSNAREIAVDFMHLPFDRRAEYSVPLYWNLYGLLGPASKPTPTWKAALQSKKLSIWGDELNVLHLLLHSGVKVEARLEEEDSKGLQNDVKAFVAKLAQIWNPDLQAETPEELLDGAEWIQMPLARAVPYLSKLSLSELATSPEDSKYHFVLPEDGGAMELGLLAIGEKSSQPYLAKQLINELLSTDHILEVHNRLGTGVVHKTLDNMDSLPVWQRPQALRQFPLNRLRFPDLNIEVLPRFERLYDETVESENRN